MVIESVSVISTKWLRVYLTIYGLNRRVVEMRGEGGGKRISAKGKEEEEDCCLGCGCHQKWFITTLPTPIQVCRFCWHRIRTDENGLCPHCREVRGECGERVKGMTAAPLRFTQPYAENPAEYIPLTQDQ